MTLPPDRGHLATEQRHEASRSLDELSTLDAVNDIARSGLAAWNTLLIVLVGDAEKVQPQLEEVGFPPAELVDMEGNPIAER